MSTILEDLSDEALARANEANRCAISPYYYAWPGVEVHSSPDLCWCITDIPFPMCNAAFKASLKPEKVDSAIEDFIAGGRKRNVPLLWLMGMDIGPAKLRDSLVSHGFTSRGDAPAMSINLHAINESSSVPAGFTISEVKNTEDLKTWGHIVADGFSMPEGGQQATIDWFSKCIESGLPMKFYLGSLNGNPVATSMYFLAAGVAGIYFVATLPEARRQGIGFAITLRPLLEAREIGYRVGILQASKMGAPVYLKMGFREDCKLGSYLWMPPKKDK